MDHLIRKKKTAASAAVFYEQVKKINIYSCSVEVFSQEQCLL
jgi:hypothetical protein